MESEERPSKIRKLEHGAAELEPVVGSLSPVKGTTEQNDSKSVHEEILPTNSVKDSDTALESNVEGNHSTPKISKNQLKKQRRFERWEAGREDRKVKRKEKIKAKKERRREEWRQTQDDQDGDATAIAKPTKTQNIKDSIGTQVPITVIFDCDFEKLMFDSELKSLGHQITRGYSDNRKAYSGCTWQSLISVGR